MGKCHPVLSLCQQISERDQGVDIDWFLLYKKKASKGFCSFLLSHSSLFFFACLDTPSLELLCVLVFMTV